MFIIHDENSPNILYDGAPGFLLYLAVFTTYDTRMFDGIIFDLDGTLWDAVPTTVIGWNNALKDLGIEKRVTIEGIQSVTGKPEEECMEILIPGLKDSQLNATLLMKLSRYLDKPN